MNNQEKANFLYSPIKLEGNSQAFPHPAAALSKGNGCRGILSNIFKEMSLFFEQSYISGTACMIGCHGWGHFGLELKDAVKTTVPQCPRVVIMDIACDNRSRTEKHYFSVWVTARDFPLWSHDLSVYLTSIWMHPCMLTLKVFFPGDTFHP